MGRRIRTRYDLLKPSLVDRVVKKQEVQARGHDKIPKVELEQGDHVYYKNYSSVGPPNIPGTVETRTGPVSCKVRNQSGELVRRHFSQLFKQLPSESAVRGKGGNTEMAVPSSVPILPEVESDLAVSKKSMVEPFNKEEKKLFRSQDQLPIRRRNHQICRL